MADDNNDILSGAKKSMQKSLGYLESELAKIRAGKVSPNILNGIMVEYYGNPTPIDQVGNISVADARTLTIQPWEKKVLKDIERAITAANIGINPQNDGNLIRLFMPPLTEERRKDLVKMSYAEGEQAKISIRSIRREAMELIRKRKNEGMSEDEAKNKEDEVQQLTNKFIGIVDKYLVTKEGEIMEV